MSNAPPPGSPDTVQAALRERVKELRTLYAASRLLHSTQPMTERLQQLADLLPHGFMYPEATAARITVGPVMAETDGFRQTDRTISVPIPDAESGEAGELTVVLLEEKVASEGSLFLREEENLVEAIATMIGTALLHARTADVHAQTIASLDEAVLVVGQAGADRKIVSANPAASRIFGYSIPELTGQTTELLHVSGQQFEEFGRASEAAIERDGVFHGYFPMRRRDGSIFDAEQTVTLLEPHQGVRGRAVSVIRDVSLRRTVEDALQDSEARFRQVAAHIDHVFWIRAAGATGMEYVSPAYERVWGRSPEPLYQDAGAWWAHLLPSDRARLADLIAEVPSDGWEVEYRVIRPDGSVRWILDRAFAVCDASDRVYRVIGVAEDITTRKEMEQRFGVLSQEITDVIYVVGTDGNILLCSPSIEPAIGMTPAEVVGTSAFHLVHAEDVGELRDRFGEVVATQGGIVRAQYRLRTREGQWRHVESVARNLIDHPAVGGVLVTTRDITDRLLMEDRARQAQKLEAVGRLAGGIAHDFNNILTVIRSQSELLLMDERDTATAGEIAVIQEATDRAARLTAQLLAFSRDQVLRPRTVDINDVLRGINRIVERAAGERIRVAYAMASGQVPVLVDPAQLEQVILNLVVNARDAMPQGGTIRITTAIGTDEDDCAELRVADTGVGMPERIRSRIFEPFFSTKPTGKGTGLGLAVVYGVVTQSGGTIRVDSVVGRGTEFRLKFPLAATSADIDSGDGAERAIGASGGGRRVLLVEDEPHVRRVTRTLLHRAGYEVTDVADAETALTTLPGGSFDIVLTDLGLPGISGRELIDRLLAEQSGLSIIVMSGYDVDSPADRVRLPSGVQFLPKPFTRDELMRAIAAAAPGGAVPD
ncbi:MAG TPA: PAS domain S-box protein [Longimicrobiales bacterium]|nr:PAS domain S-box protein [Longimicrobiales bacterium]